ncbi:MAG: c-type cytochrome [Thermoguttaceae bacterium]
MRHRGPLVLLLSLAAGCWSSPAPQFELNTEGHDPASLPMAKRKAVQETLTRLFGTPDAPSLPAGTPLDLTLHRIGAGPAGADAAGNQWGLFRRHCAGCHGVSGDGAGPAAAALDPYPRDFRDGVFKFTSTAGGAKPLRADLLRTLRQGVHGTAMPSFQKLTDRQLEALVACVQYLAIRGETELYVIQQVVDDDAPLPLDASEVIDAIVSPTVRSWKEAGAARIVAPQPVPTATPGTRSASIARGRTLFNSSAAQCAKCHGSAGDGHGQQTELYDRWNQRKVGATPEESRRLASRFRLPVERLHARDFTLGAFRGGDRPIDQYWRIDAGIKGTPMPASGPAAGSPGALKPNQIWDLVHFVRSLKGAGDGAMH